MSNGHNQFEQVLEPAVKRSATIREMLVERGALTYAGPMVRRWFDGEKVVVFADDAGFGAAGETLVQNLEAAGLAVTCHVIAADPLPKPTVELAETFRAQIAAPGIVPVSLGSGVINDLVKYAAYLEDRPYMAVATAASMDGYASAGAPLAKGGFKMTIPARAPRVILADLEVIAAAPREMTSWGYADLAGKVAAGGDWILADALGIEPLDDVAWPLVQDNLSGWLSGPEAVAEGDFDATARLFSGLCVVGLAMEFHGSSRPASGADHQIAHMWEMQGLEHDGRPVAHGACVAVGCMSVIAMFDWLLGQDLCGLDPDAIARNAPSLADKHTEIEASMDDPRIIARAKLETQAKHPAPEVLKNRLTTLTTVWPDLRERLRTHLTRREEMAHLLRAAGAPVEPDDIGVSPAHLKATMRASRFIRSRYTLLDLLVEAGMLEQAINETVRPE